jgi:hypothetical protein
MKKLILLIAVLGISSVTLAQSKIEGLGFLKIGSDVSLVERLPKTSYRAHDGTTVHSPGLLTNKFRVKTCFVTLLTLTDSLKIINKPTSTSLFAEDIILSFLDNKLVWIHFSNNYGLKNTFTKLYGPTEQWSHDDIHAESSLDDYSIYSKSLLDIYLYESDKASAYK